MTHEWTNLSATNRGNGATGTVTTPTLLLSVGAPNAGAKLLRTLFRMTFNCAGTATGVSITPDWVLDQVVGAACDAQFAGSTAVPDYYGVRDPNRVVTAPLDIVYANQSFTTSQGSVALSTRGLVSSAAERTTPPAGGWQVAAGFTWNDDAGFVTGFGSNFRWHWRAELSVLWDV